MNNDKPEWVVGIDLGATKIAAGLVNPENEVVKKVYRESKVEAGPEAVVELFADCLAKLQSSLPPKESLAALSVCCPGPLNHVSGMVLDPPNMTGWLNVPLQNMVEARLGLPCPIEHDAKAAALGEFYFGAGREIEDMIFIVVGTGVGAAIITKGQLYRGSHNIAGEVGHITVDMHGPACSCGSNGCLEGYVAGPDLVDRFRELIVGRDITCPAEADGKFVADLAAAGQVQAQQVFKQAGQALGIGVATMAHLLDIDTFIIGGSVAKAGELLLIPTRAAVQYRAYASMASRVTVVGSPLGDDAAILGCAWLARQQL